MKLLSFLLFAVVALAQVPAAPECLTRPVTLGTVTVSCSLLDNSISNGEGLGPTLLSETYIFQVRVVSTDPDVIAVRIGVTYQAPAYREDGSTIPATVWGSVGKSTGNSILRPTPGYRYTFVLGGPGVTGIVIQELKASTSQAF